MNQRCGSPPSLDPGGIAEASASGERGSGPLTGGRQCWSFSGPCPRLQSGGAQGVSIFHIFLLRQGSGPRWWVCRRGRERVMPYSRSAHCLVSRFRARP